VGGATRYCSEIVRACDRYDEKVTLEFSDGQTYNCKKIMEIMYAVNVSINEERKMKIIIEPKTAVSKDLGLLVYSSFTEEDWRKAGNSRFKHER